ncbi:MAG: hypothetical protein QOG49_56 [Frankiaceae bacterium]|nr:hypothetical protein [Frankiaceae bacterium]
MRAGQAPAFLGIGLAAIAIGVAGGHSASVAAPDPQRLRVVSVSRGGRVVSALVSVPPVLSGRTVPAEAFSVRVGGVATPVKVTRPGVSTTRLTVVLDVPGADAADLPVVKGAIADFLVHLPADQAVSLMAIDAARVPESTTDRAKSLGVLRDMVPAQPSSIESALSGVIARAGARPGWRSVVVFVSARTKEFGKDVRFRPGGPLVYAVTSPRGSGSAAAAAKKSGGTFGQWVTGGRLLALLDAVTADLAGQYRLEFADSGARPVDIVAAFEGTRVEVAIPAPAEPLAAPSAANAASSAAAAPSPAATSAGGDAGTVARSRDGDFRRVHDSSGRVLPLLLASLALVAGLALLPAMAVGRSRTRHRDERYALSRTDRTDPDASSGGTDPEAPAFIEVPEFARLEKLDAEPPPQRKLIDLTDLPAGGQADEQTVEQPGDAPRLIDIRDVPDSVADTVPRRRKRR